MKKIKYHINSITDINCYVEDYKLVNISQGANQEICLLAVNAVPQLEKGMFPQSQTQSFHNYKVILISERFTHQINLLNQSWSYHFVQPIDSKNILLACGRSHYYKDNSYDKNGKVYTNEGTFIREFLLGDGIQDLKVTAQNNIWTSYFDEGVFGNYGWKNPVGAAGLRAWNCNGSEIYKYNNYGDHSISDCYALNVVNDNEVWFYFYTNFELACRKNGEIKYYKTEIAGSDGFIVYDKYVLFRGGYRQHNNYYLYQVNSSDMRLLGEVSLINKDESLIETSYIDCRKSKLLLLSGTELYSVDLKELVEHFIYNS